MSAIPKKKLCWNCEGHISHDVDNCPYCGVYVHAREFDEDPVWNPNYQKFSKENEDSFSEDDTEEHSIPAPLYKISLNDERLAQEEIEFSQTPRLLKAKTAPFSAPSNNLLYQLKQDLFPILFLMMGSIFFLFGVVLLLFSENGTLVLKWEESYSTYFLILAVPLITAGWHYLQQIHEEEP